jgi:hypothetical protein
MNASMRMTYYLSNFDFELEKGGADAADSL